MRILPSSFIFLTKVSGNSGTIVSTDLSLGYSVSVRRRSSVELFDTEGSVNKNDTKSDRKRIEKLKENMKGLLGKIGHTICIVNLFWQFTI